MDFSTLIFSRNRKIVFARHTLFWVIWISLYSITTILWRLDKLPRSVNFIESTVEVALSTVIDMFYCYTIIYFLIPRFFFKARFTQFFFLWVLHNILALLLFRLFEIFLVPHIRHFYKVVLTPPPHFYVVALNSFLSIGFEGCVAAAIVLGKYWYKTNQHLLRVKKEHKKVLTHIKLKEQFVVPYPVLQTIWQEANPVYLAADFQDAALLHDNNTAFDLLERTIQSAQVTLLPLYEELQSVIAFHELKKNYVSHFYLEYPELNDDFEISPNLLLSLTSLPFLNVETLQKEKDVQLNIMVEKEVLTYHLQWMKSNSLELLNKLQYEALTYLKNTIDFNYPSSNEFYLAANGNEVNLKVMLNLKQHI